MIRILLSLALAAGLVSAGSRAVADEASGAASITAATVTTTAPAGHAPGDDLHSYSAAFDDNGYFYSNTVALPFAEAVAKAKDELKKIGFGVLFEIDFQAKMKEKVGKDIPPCLILGACHPGLAYEVYSREEWIGILMPCNVVVRELADGTVQVGIKNSLMLPQATGNASLQEPAEEVNALTLDFITAMGQ